MDSFGHLALRNSGQGKIANNPPSTFQNAVTAVVPSILLTSKPPCSCQKNQPCRVDKAQVSDLGKAELEASLIRSFTHLFSKH